MSAAEKTQSPTDRNWSRPEFMRIAHMVEEITGISFPPNRRRSAETVMLRLMGKLRIDNPVSLEIGVSRRGAVMQALLDDLTIGESYFFREPAQFRFMSEELLPKWSSSWPAERKLKVWSAGCAAGQEPYSVAIMLREKGWKRSSRILGTDISEARLNVAREANFSKWSLRTLSAETSSKWFARKGTNYELLPAVKSAVDFKLVNLLDPTPEPDTLGQDAIFCRNVLIYFELPAIVRIAERLLSSLGPDGWLFLGASDPHLAELMPCEVVVLPGCTAYRRTTAAQSTYALRNAPLTLLIPDESTLLPSENLDVSDDVVEDWAPVADVEVEQSQPDIIPQQDAEKKTGPEHAIARTRELANEGRLAEAGEVCSAALERFPDQAQLHLITAILSGEAGRWTDSERAARRAVYLDRSLVLAHVALGDSLARLGNLSAARRSFENASTLLVSDRSEESTDSEEMSPARLMDIVRAHLSMIDSEETKRRTTPVMRRA